MLQRYIAGNNMFAMLKFIKNIKHKTCIINYIKENEEPIYQNNSANQDIYKEYNNLINNISQFNISNNTNHQLAVKLSSLNFDNNLINKLVEQCKIKNIKLIIDAECNKNIDNYRTIINNLMFTNNNDKINIIKTYQMYRKDSYNELLDDIKTMNTNNKLLSTKLVRGAYWNSEYKDNHLFTNKQDTDNNYNDSLILVNKCDIKYNIIATHNKESIIIANALFANYKQFNNYSIAHLLGMNEYYMNNSKNNMPQSVYIPYGPYKEAIPYMMRRLYENMDSFKYLFK